jgi:lysophospholipase L1-like esterase
MKNKNRPLFSPIFLIGRLLAAFLALAVLEAAAGFVVGDRDTRLATISKRTAATSYGYLAPHQRRTLLFPGLPPYRVTVDGLGLRLTKPMPVAKTPKHYRILCIGDSLTFGLFVDDEDTFPFLLQQLLDRRGAHYEVLNAGLGSLSLVDELYYLERVGLRLDPDLVILSFCGNDFSEAREHPEPFYDRVQQDADRGPLESLVWRVKRTGLYRLFGMAEVHYKYFRYLLKLDDPEVRNILRHERRDPESLQRIARFGAPPITIRPDDPEFAQDWSLYFATLDRLHELLRSRKIALLYVLFPGFLEVAGHEPGRYLDRLRNHAGNRGIATLDLLPALKTRSGDLLRLYHAPPRDFHFSREGNALIAEAIAATLPVHHKR